MLFVSLARRQTRGNLGSPGEAGRGGDRARRVARARLVLGLPGWDRDELLGGARVDGHCRVEVCLGGPHLDPDGLDLLGVICGSEGQFGVVTEATLRILHKPEGARPVLIGFDTNEVAGECVSDIIKVIIDPIPSVGSVPGAARRLLAVVGD